MKCRQTGIIAEVYAKMGMAVVNMPGGEICPAAQRGVIDCAEWVGGIEDLRLGLHLVWKYHYTPGMHENDSIGELIFNNDVWESLPAHQETSSRPRTETFMRWWAMCQKQNADAIQEMTTKHGVKILRRRRKSPWRSSRPGTRWLRRSRRRTRSSRRSMNSQKAYAAKVVPAKRFMFPPYNLQADHYFPPKPN